MNRISYVALTLAVSSLALGLGPVYAGAGIVLDQIDDFEDGTVMGWEEGIPTTNPPINRANGGPTGAGDNFLENTADGTPGPGGKMVMFNSLQWAGDASAAGINLITADVKRVAGDPLFLRLAIEGGPSGNTRYGSTTAVELSLADTGWVSALFDLNDMSLISGTDSLGDVLADIGTLRILSAESGPAWQGDEVASTLGVDNITATRVPVAGTVLGMSVRRLQCRNVTTGQQVALNNPGDPWSCEAAGLTVHSGDKVVVQLQGGAD